MMSSAEACERTALKRAPPMRWEFTWIGGLLGTGEKIDCNGQILEIEVPE